MPSTVPPLRRARLAPALGLVAAAALAGGCGLEKPAPAVSVVSGGTFERAEARCWSFDDEPIDLEGGCLGGEEADVLPLEAGQTVGISVDPEVAETGWLPFLGATPLVSGRDPLRDHYFRFTVSPEQVSGGPQPLRVVAFESGQPRGSWSFVLEP